MVSLTALLTTLVLQTLVITRVGSRAVEQAPQANFTGDVHIERLFEAAAPFQSSGAFVTFAPGARTAWHSHPAGQILVVTAGVGRVQLWGQAIQEIRTGDVVTIPPGVKHWHGASPQTSMTHLGITEVRDGVAVRWMEKVTDEQYSGDMPASAQNSARPSGELQQRIAPGLATLTDDVLYGDVWPRPELSPRDRSLVTISVLIATGKTAQLTGHLTRALTNGVTPREASALLAHLAIYCGWPNAVSALEVYDQVYKARNIDTSNLRAVSSPLPAPAADAAPERATQAELGNVSPKFIQLTNDLVFETLWRQPELSVRDRSLVTIAALAATGDDDQLDVYLRLGVENGLTRAQIAEAFTHLGFYAGWPKATKALAALAKTQAR
jgi:4-carboxymuconolactone decarboxylase